MVRTWSRPYGLCHRLHTKAHIEGFGSPYLHVYVCLLLYFMLVLASLVLGLSALDALNGFMVVWLHPTSIRHFLDVTTWDASPRCRLLRSYLSPFWSVRWYACHACLYPRRLCLHFYTFVYMFMHESCLLMCRPCFNTMKLWIFDSNIHLSLADTTFCLLSCVFACLSSCFLVCLCILLVLSPATCYACHVYHICLAYFPSIACLLVSSLCLCMYAHGVRTHGVRARSTKHKQKRRKCKHVDMSRAVAIGLGV